MSKSKSGTDGPITIKKYANRRLYNTSTSSYVTLDTLAEMVKEGTEFAVYDAKSGEDITKSVLTQIIFDEEAKGQNLLPIQFLRQLISYYDDNMKVFVPPFLEMSMESFSRSQDDIRSRLADAFDPETTFKKFEEQIQKNMAMFQSTMKMFAPFTPPGFDMAPGVAKDEPAPAEPASKEEAVNELNDLKSQLADMQAQLDKLSKE